MNSVDEFREWKPDEWRDEVFLRNVPPRARKEFLQTIRPLSLEFQEQIRHALFAGIKHPFDFLKATGWMHRLLRTGCELPDHASSEERANFMAKRLPWLEQDVVLLMPPEDAGYATLWGKFLRCFRVNHFNFDTILVCHPRLREVVLFWEGYGLPALGKRGTRELPCPDLALPAGGADG